MLKKGDFILIGGILVVALSAFGLGRLFFSQGTTVVISENNVVLYTLPLNEDKTVILPHNTIEIKNGAVQVISADCKNQICVNHKKISGAGQSIVCLPNKVLVEVEKDGYTNG